MIKQSRGKANNVQEVNFGDDLQSIPANEHVKRAMEVALSGGHIILVLVPPELLESFNWIGHMLNDLQMVVHEYCSCGYYKHPKKACVCQSSEIIKYYANLHVETFPISVEAVAPRNWRDYTMLSEPLKTVLDRVKIVRCHERKLPYSVHADALSLLDTAIQRLLLNVRHVLSVAYTIALMEDSDVIQSHHISEAIQYQIGIHGL